MQGQYLYKYPVFICILPCCPGQYTKKIPSIYNEQLKQIIHVFDPAKHSKKISPFNTNKEIYSATIENTVVSHARYARYARYARFLLPNFQNKLPKPVVKLLIGDFLNVRIDFVVFLFAAILFNVRRPIPPSNVPPKKY